MTYDTGDIVTYSPYGPAWKEEAICLTVDPELFYPEESGGQWGEAKKVCLGCPVRRQCGAYAMESERGQGVKHRTGVWGGLTPRQRFDLDQQVGA